jgi:hypothetical protein
MPQGRILLKNICQSKKLADLRTDGARLLYTWLIPNLDINGCFSGDPAVVNGQVFTRLGKSQKVVAQYLNNLAETGLIIIYETNGDFYLHVPDFVDKQPSLNPEKEAKPTIPLPTPEQLQSKSGVTPLKVKESKGKDKVKESKPFSHLYEKFWNRFKGRWSKEKGKYIKGKKREGFEVFEQLSESDQQYAVGVADRAGGEYCPDAPRWLKEKRFEDFPLPKGVPQ